MKRTASIIISPNLKLLSVVRSVISNWSFRILIVTTRLPRRLWASLKRFRGEREPTPIRFGRYISRGNADYG